MKRLILVLLALVVFGSTAVAEDLDAIFKRVNELVEDKNYTKALEELSWARKEIEKMNMTKVEQFFPDELAGFKGDKFESQAALGFSAMERNYRKDGTSTQVKASLVGGMGGTGMEGLGGLAGMGRMAAMMGGGPNTVRIAGRTATMESDEDAKSADLTLFLDSGSILRFEMSGDSDTAALKKMAEEIKIDELESYLRGSSK